MIEIIINYNYLATQVIWMFSIWACVDLLSEEICHYTGFLDKFKEDDNR